VIGTVPYMAPEQIRGEAVDVRTDLFAFGIILYELLTGRRPFRGATSGMICAAILNDTPEPVQATRADLPGDVDWIVSRCLEKERRTRFQTALDIGNELRRLKRTPEGPAPAKTAALEAASIVVLPFLNRSRDKEDEYFSDGLADELLNMLAKIRGLRVAARTSSFHFKGKGSSLAEVGKALNVATVLEGSVRRSGDRVRRLL
jgi:serine/threonine protein kinase